MTAGGEAPATAGSRRLLRVSVLSSVVLALALAAHAGAGGGLPPWPGVVLSAVPVVLTAIHLTGVRVSFGALVGTLGALQVLLHVAFHALHGAAGVSMATSRALLPTPPHAGHGAHLAHAGATGDVLSPPGGFAALVDGLAPSVPMLLLHVTATLLAAWFLAVGEQRLWRALRRLWRWPVPGDPPVVAPTPSVAAPPPAVRGVVGGLPVGSRAPPRRVRTRPIPA